MRRVVVMSLLAMALVGLVAWVVTSPTEETPAAAARELSHTYGLQGAAGACAAWKADDDGSDNQPNLVVKVVKSASMAADYSRRWSPLKSAVKAYAQHPDGARAARVSAVCRTVPSTDSGS